jgi:uncharacterized membrane protein YgcG
VDSVPSFSFPPCSEKFDPWWWLVRGFDFGSVVCPVGVVGTEQAALAKEITSLEVGGTKQMKNVTSVLQQLAKQKSLQMWVVLTKQTGEKD